MNQNVIKGIGILGTVLSLAATVISSWSDKQERKAETREIVNEEMKKYLEKEETIVETEEELL